MINQFEDHVKKTYRGESRYQIIAGIAEELGEIAQALKNYDSSDDDQINDLALEIGDLIRYATLLAVKEDIQLKLILRANMTKMERRYPKYFKR